MTRPAQLRLFAALLLLGSSGCFLPRWNRQVPVDHPVVTTDSGVTYQDILQGLGPSVDMTSEVTLDYRVKLIDETPVDSTYDRGQPLTFLMSEAPLPGWQEALIGMRAGGTRTAELPPETAYGADGIEGLVPPNAVLLCEFEMLQVASPRPE